MKIIITLLLLFSVSCISHQESYVDIAYRIRKNTAEQLEKEKALWWIGYSGQMPEDIENLGLEFDYFQMVNLEEARELLVYAIQTFLHNVNSSKEVRPFLHDYPFTTKNLRLVIWIYQQSGKEVEIGYLCAISLDRNKLIYELAKTDKQSTWPILHEETYEEALEALRKSGKTTDLINENNNNTSSSL